MEFILNEEFGQCITGSENAEKFFANIEENVKEPECDPNIVINLDGVLLVDQYFASQGLARSVKYIQQLNETLECVDRKRTTIYFKNIGNITKTIMDNTFKQNSLACIIVNESKVEILGNVGTNLKSIFEVLNTKDNNTIGKCAKFLKIDKEICENRINRLIEYGLVTHNVKRYQTVLNGIEL